MPDNAIDEAVSAARTVCVLAAIAVIRNAMTAVPPESVMGNRLDAARLILDYDLKIRAVRNHAATFGNAPIGLD